MSHRRKSCSRSRCRFVFFSAAALFVLALAGPARAILINEIMYQPQDLDDRPWEYLELYNETNDPLDLSGYSFCEGISFTFPDGTWMDPRSYLVVCAVEAKIQSRYGITNTIGDWYTNSLSSPSLDNGGERVTLCNPGGKVVVTVKYNDRGKWPAGAAGTGHSLSLISPYTDPEDPDSWALSPAVGGTPGDFNGLSAQEGSGPPPAKGLDGAGFILDWLILGPYTGAACTLGARLTGDWLIESASGVKETALTWNAGQVVNTNYTLAESDGLHPNAGTPKPTMRHYTSATDTVNLNDSVYPPDPNNVMAYNFVYVDNVTAAPIAVDLACASDDGISILLNGAYVWSNDACRGSGAPGEVQDRAPATLAVGKNLIALKSFENGGGWSFRLRFENRGTGIPITSRSVIQITTNPALGLHFGGGGTPIEPTTPPPPPGAAPGESPVIISEGFLRSSGERWIELQNRSASSIDLAGYHLTDDPRNLTKYTFAGSTPIVSGAYRAFTDASMGLDLSVNTGRTKVFTALVDPPGTSVLDAAFFEPQFDGFSEARLPGDGRLYTDGADPTRDAANSITVNQDVVLNEIMYHPIDDDDRKEYVELYNRGPGAVVLTGWSLTDALHFDFPAGTSIASHNYLVIARDPALVRTIYGLTAAQVLGPTTPDAQLLYGTLKNSGERITLVDELGRTVNTVRFHDGGEWPQWADGGGSSLELIDPAQDNHRGQAWDASDDSAKAPVNEYTYIGRHLGGDPEFSMILLDKGIAVVDDVSIIAGGITTQDTPLIDAGESWKYAKGTAAPPATWVDPDFVDTGWLTGASGIGYGDNDDATPIPDMQQVGAQPGYMTIFCRKIFDVADVNDIESLILSVIVDDGFYAYLNGTQVASSNVTSPAFDAPAPSAIEPTLVERDLTSFKNLLVNGTNVLAVQVHNAGLASSDLSFIPRLLNRVQTSSGGAEQVTNGTFDANTTGWFIQGTHGHSGRTTQSPISGAGSLKILASGRGDNKGNWIMTPEPSLVGLANLPLNQDLIISFKARWVVGSRGLLTFGHEHEMARSHVLGVPLDLGTPGKQNSVTARQIAKTGSSNLGPVIYSVTNTPAVPGPGEATVVSAKVSDADGVASVLLRWSLDNPSATPASIPMTLNTVSGNYEATVPGQAQSARVVFFIQATDSGGRPGRYPVDVAQRTHPMLLNPPAATLNEQRFLIYRHDQRYPATSFQSYRFWMTQASQDILSNGARLSNEHQRGSFVFGGSRIYHEAETRFSGSPWARGGWGGSFRVKMPDDDPLHGRIPEFGLEDNQGDGANARTRITHYLLRMSQGGHGVPYGDAFTLVRWQVNDATVQTREHNWVPDGNFISRWFPGDDAGDFLEMDDRFVISKAGALVTNTDGRVLYPPPSSRSDGDGLNKENYRWFFGLRARNGDDEFSSFQAFAKVMDPAVTPDALFDQQIWDYANVEELVRTWAVEMNIDDWDSWGLSRGKNCYFYRPDIDGRFHLLPWDFELTYGDVNANIIPPNPASPFNPGGFGEVNRMLSRPRIRRMYYSVLNEMVNGPKRWFHSDRLGEYASRLAALGMTNTGVAAPGGYIDQRAALVQPRLQSVIYPQIRFTITTNGGAGFASATATVNLSGTAPVDVNDILVVQNGDGGTLRPPTNGTLTTWDLTAIPLIPGANQLDLYGLDLEGNVVDSDSIVVTYNVVWSTPSISSLNPSSALPGADIEVLGSDFHTGVRVFFGAVESPLVSYSETGPTPGKIVARVPAGTGTTTVTVRNLDGKTSNQRAFTYLAAASQFVRGDANGDGQIDLSDAVKILLVYFTGAPTNCADALDVNDNEVRDITDAIYLLQFLYQGGAAPKAPYPTAGVDPSGTALDCAR